MQAETENIILAQDQVVDVNPEDDDLAHLLRHEGSGNAVAATLHRMAHVFQYIERGGDQSQLS